MSFEDISARMKQAQTEATSAPPAAESFRVRARMVGVLLRDARLSAGRSPEDCARLLHVDAAQVERWELGDEVPSLPQLELLAWLRANGFRTFIVSGGGIDLIRAFAEDVYGIPNEQVVGSSVKLHLEEQGGQPVLMKLGELNSFDDREAKVQNIGLHIGRRPILAFGNSDGDLAMMRYTLAGPGARLALLLHHDDADREVAYDRDFRLSPLVDALDKAADYGITVVSMKNDWNRVFDQER